MQAMEIWRQLPQDAGMVRVTSLHAVHQQQNFCFQLQRKQTTINGEQDRRPDRQQDQHVIVSSLVFRLENPVYRRPST